MRIGKDEALAGMPVAQMSVLDGDDFERFHGLTLTSDVRV